MSVIFGKSTRGQPTVIYHGFEYIKDRDNVNGTVAWRCQFYKSMKCKTRLVTLDDRVISEKQLEHTHSGNKSKSMARKAVGEMKSAMSDMTVTPSSSQANVSVGLEDRVLQALPKRRTLSRSLQRYRSKVVQADNRGNPLPALPSDLHFDIPNQFADMILYDSGPGDDRIIIIGCNQLLDGLARADVWLADGTFKVVPSVFFQLYSIHFNFSDGLNPAAIYCLLPCKTENTYNRALAEIHRLIPSAAPV